MADIGFKKLMRYCNTVAEYEQTLTDGIITEDVFVIVLEEKVAKFKGQTFDWSGGVDTSALATKEELENLTNEILKNEEVSAAAFNGLNQRIDNVDISLDSELSDTSTSAVENKAIKSYVDASSANVKAYTDAEVAKKVDKVEGKQLSTEDFTTALKTKLEGLSNYDDTELSDAVARLRDDFDSLTQEDISAAIENFNEIISFLDGIEDSESLDSIIASIEQQIANKQDKIEDLETIRSGAVLGATAIQEHQDISHLATKEELTALQDEVIDNEEVTATALNELSERIDSISGNLSGEAATKEELEAAVQSLTEADTTNRTEVDASITAVSERVATVESAIETNIPDTYATKMELSEAIELLTNEVVDNEEVLATALNDVNDRLQALSENVSGETVTKTEFESTVATLNETIDTKADSETTEESLSSLGTEIAAINESIALLATKEELETLDAEHEEITITNEEILATAITDLNARIESIVARLDAAGI